VAACFFLVAQCQVLAAPPIFLGKILPFVYLARGILLGVIIAGKGKNEVEIL
jgi:hypothetical protein